MLYELVGGRAANLGFDNELDYWNSKGGTGGTIEQSMTSYLGGLGYTGDPVDMLNAWLISQIGSSQGTIGDNARAFVGN